MSAFTGHQGKGARRAARETRRADAAKRDRDYGLAVLAVAIAEAVPEDEARRILRAERAEQHRTAGER
jgi:hypothetical protein